MIYEVLLILAGLVLLVGGAEAFVRGAARLAGLAGISPLVIGLTVVAFGTSAPEVAVSLQAGFAGQPGVAIGNVIGSNIANVLLVLGLSATILPLAVSHQLVRLDVPIMIGVSVAFLVLGLDGNLDRLDGLLLFSSAIAYTASLLIQSRRQTLRERREDEARAAAAREDEDDEFTRAYSIPVRATPRRWLLLACLTLVGAALLVLGSRWLVQGAVAIASAFGVSELVIGITVVAIGTSLPEAATSVIASLRGERDIAVGNVVGSNIFNILIVLGLPSIVVPGGLTVPEAALRFDIPVMLAVAIACLPIFVTGHVIHRWEGALFFFYYLAYTLYLVLDSTQHEGLPVFSWVMGTFVLPLTAITLGVVLWRYLRLHRRGEPEVRRDAR